MKKEPNKFVDVRRSGKTFVDKSQLISEIYMGIPTYVFSRPHGFGKTLNLDMIDAFYNVEYADDDLFDGLKVSGNPKRMEHRGKHPVIHISLNGLTSENYEEFVDKVKSLIMEQYRKHEYLRGSKWSSIFNFDRICSGDLSDMNPRHSTNHLCEMLKDHHHNEVIVLIDDYDYPIMDSSGKEHYGGVIDLLDRIVSVVTNNESVLFTVVTASMDITWRQMPITI